MKSETGTDKTDARQSAGRWFSWFRLGSLAKKPRSPIGEGGPRPHNAGPDAAERPAVAPETSDGAVLFIELFGEDAVRIAALDRPPLGAGCVWEEVEGADRMEVWKTPSYAEVRLFQGTRLLAAKRVSGPLALAGDYEAVVRYYGTTGAHALALMAGGFPRGVVPLTRDYDAACRTAIGRAAAKKRGAPAVVTVIVRTGAQPVSPGLWQPGDVLPVDWGYPAPDKPLSAAFVKDRHINMVERYDNLRSRLDNTWRNPYAGAFLYGVDAAEKGLPESSCPYKDVRSMGTVTFSRGFGRAWLDGYGQMSRLMRESETGEGHGGH